jgi:fructoselysine-6-P-deglycase FrlB-like protein
VSETTPFEADIAEQPDALRRLLEAPSTASELATIAGRPWDRIVFTGMGSSHFAAIPAWRRLVNKGLPTWAIDTGELVDNPSLLTTDSLLIVTSQSGASGEVVELLDRLADEELPVGAVLGVAADDESPLAVSADVYLPLHSGKEATVSTKSYLNTLAVHCRIAAAFTGEDPARIDDGILAAAEQVAAVIGNLDVNPIGTWVHDLGAPRLVAVGKADASATAQYAALITKESSKVPIEGFVGGQFRHGPFELAGPGLVAFLFGASAHDGDSSISRLAHDLISTGSEVVLIGDLCIEGAQTLEVPVTGPLEALATASVAAQLVAVDIARARGLVPGAFEYGSKVTTAL